MTKEAFDNQKWYKNMPVWANGQKCYVREVRFMTGEINVIYKIGATSGVTWDFCLVETSPPEPTALDLIAQEREKQISKGYTVEHDAKCYPYGGLIEIASNLVNFIPGHAVELCPSNWNIDYWLKLCNLDYKERVRISATWMARELERLLHLENKEQ